MVTSIHDFLFSCLAQALTRTQSFTIEGRRPRPKGQRDGKRGKRTRKMQPEPLWTRVQPAVQRDEGPACRAEGRGLSQTCDDDDDVIPQSYANPTSTLPQPYANPTSAIRQPYVNPTSILLRSYSNTTSILLQPYFNPTSILLQS